MRCRPGDLAVITTSQHGNVGCLVRVMCRSAEPLLPSWWCEALCWVKDGWGFSHAPGTHGECPDAWMRPIRPGEGADETLSWKSVPKAPDVIEELQSIRELME